MSNSKSVRAGHQELLTRIGSNLKSLRQEAELTQEELGAIAAVSATYISEIENGKRDLSVAVLSRLSIGVGCDPYQMMSTQRQPSIQHQPRTTGSVPDSLMEEAGAWYTWPNVEISDMILPDPEIADIVEHIVEQHTNATRLHNKGCEPIGSIAISGTRGTGKTMLAKVIATKIGLPLYHVDGSRLEPNSWTIIQRLYRRLPPCVFVIKSEILETEVLYETGGHNPFIVREIGIGLAYAAYAKVLIELEGFDHFRLMKLHLEKHGLTDEKIESLVETLSVRPPSRPVTYRESMEIIRQVKAHAVLKGVEIPEAVDQVVQTRSKLARFLTC
jgi:transcriptional regulator with XRE-family HTH domain